MTDESPAPAGEGAFAEALRASPEMVDVAIPLLLAAFPQRQVLRGAVGRLAALYVDPPLEQHERRRLLGFLYELADRTEWVEKSLVAREVTDVTGARLELLLPIDPGDYDGGEAVVGPFADEEQARDWAAGIAEEGLAFDTMLVQGGVLVDLFALGELLEG